MFFWIQRKTNLTLRRLLRVDDPVDERSEVEVAQEVADNYRWNFTVNLLDGAFYWFGANFVASTTIVPLFISKLTDSPLPVGIVAMIAQGGWFLPQIFTANVVERLARKKAMVVNLGLFTERVPMLLLVLAAALALAAPGPALWLFLLGYAWHGLGAGLVATSWQDLIARVFPVARRGRFFGTTMFVGAGMGVLGASLSTWLLARYAFPLNFVWLFSLATIFMMLSWLFLALTREPAQRSQVPRQRGRQFWDQLRVIVRQDDNFRHFLIARLLLALGGMGTGFVTVTAVERWAVADSVVGFFTAAYLIGQTIGNLAFGFLADRYGHKVSLEMAGVAGLLAFLLAWLAPSPSWYYAVFILLGINLGAIIVSGILVVLEFALPERRPSYAGLTNTGAGLVSMAAPLIGSWLIAFGDGVGYTLLFGLSAAANLLSAILMRWWVQEPRFVTH